MLQFFMWQRLPKLSRHSIIHLRYIIALLPLVCAGTLVQANAKHQHTTPPKRMIEKTPAKWGAYTVTIERNAYPFQIRICIRNWHFKIVREIVCGDYSIIYTQQINNSGTPDLVITAWDGSNLLCSHTTYVFKQDGGIRNLAIITGGEGQFHRLSRHGLQFVMESSGVLEYACDLCHACEPNMPVVLNWQNGHPVDATPKYPGLSEARAASYRRNFLDTCAAWNNSKSGQSVISPAAGYYANKYELGHGRAAYQWIMHRLPTKRPRQWFRYCAKVVRYQISQIRHMTTVSQAKLLSPPGSNVFMHPPDYPKMDSLDTIP